MNWGSVSVDPNNSLMFVNDMRLGLANYMVPRENVAKGASGIEMGIVPMEGTPTARCANASCRHWVSPVRNRRLAPCRQWI